MLDRLDEHVGPSRTFALADPFGVVGEVEERLVDGKHLFLAPQLAAWVAFSGDDAVIARRLLSDEPLHDLLKGVEPLSRSAVSRVAARLLRAGFLNDRVQTADRPRYGRRVQIHLTNKCNLRCVHCYMDSGHPDPHEAGADHWRRLLSLLQHRYGNLFVSFSGGEPLVARALWPALEHAREVGADTAIITNGVRLDSTTIARLDLLIDYCAISLDGLSSETHDRIRGTGAFAKTYRNLMALESASFRKVLNITLMRTNVSEIVERLPGFLDALPFKVDVDLGAMISEGRGAETGELALSQAEFRAALDQVSARIVESSLVDHAPEGDAEVQNSSTRWRPVPIRPKLSCGYADTLTIYANGDLSTCLTPRFIRGNLFTGVDGSAAACTTVELRPAGSPRTGLPGRPPADSETLPFNDRQVSELLDRIEGERAAARVDRLTECRTCILRHICGGRCHLGQLRAGQTPSQVACPDSYKQAVMSNLVSWGSSS